MLSLNSSEYRKWFFIKIWFLNSISLSKIKYLGCTYFPSEVNLCISGTYSLAYCAADPGGSSDHWSCDTSAKTIVIDKLVDPNAFNKQRILAYPEMGDQLDMIYHDQVDGTTTFKDAIKAVKDANPKW